MIGALLPVLLVFQVDISVKVQPPRDTVPPRAPAVTVIDSATLASAYTDPGARELVRHARARQDSSDHSILAYRALARQRISVGLSTLRRERLLYRRETAARIHWRRYGPLEVDLLGAREVIPIAIPGVRVPEDLESTIPHFLFDPADNRYIMGFGQSAGNNGNDGNDGMKHPLAAGSEAHYQFARGDTTLISLPDGRSVRLIELRVTPRRSDPLLVSGSLWLEAESHAVVQAVFRLARPFDLERDLDEDDAKDIRRIPGLLKPIRADLRYLTIDYGLWEMRWWLPRLIALEGHASVGSLVRVPVRFEQSYSEYDVFTDPVPLPVPLPPIVMTLAGDTFPRSRTRCRGAGCRCIGGVCRRVEVRLPADSASLLTDSHLPASIYSAGPELIDEDEVRAITARLSRAVVPTDFVGPRLYWGLDQPGLVRYNRVEGLAAAARLGMTYGALTTDLTARLGWADRRNPGGALAVRWEGQAYQTRLGIYRDLTAVDPLVQPFGLANSAQALLWGRDDGDYYRVLGAELAGGPAPGRANRLDWRIYAERQLPVEQQTWTSLRRLWNKNDPFRPNLQADTADLLGATIDLRLARGLDPGGVRWGAALSLDGAVGSFRFLRPSARLMLAGPLPGRLVGSLEGAAGTSIGTVTAQKVWPLGGSATLRGYSPFVASGTSFWRTRAELGTRLPAGRLVLFSDLGWAGERESFPGRAPLAAAGVGASLLDGLIRLDLARALRAPTGWRFSVATDLAL